MGLFSQTAQTGQFFTEWHRSSTGPQPVVQSMSPRSVYRFYAVLHGLTCSCRWWIGTQRATAVRPYVGAPRHTTANRHRTDNTVRIDHSGPIHHGVQQLANRYTSSPRPELSRLYQTVSDVGGPEVVRRDSSWSSHGGTA